MRKDVLRNKNKKIATRKNIINFTLVIVQVM